MNGSDFNTGLAALLTAGIAFVGLGLVANGLVAPTKLEKPVLKIAGVVAAPAATGAAPEAIAPIAPLLVSADVGAGEADAKKLCSTCHNFAEGAGTKVGPDLYGVVGRDQASMAGFEYSAALKAHHGKWTFEELNHWLHGPKAYADGTKMAFAGIEDDKERADVIDYLHTLSKSPEPLPKPEAASAGGGKADATGMAGPKPAGPTSKDAGGPVPNTAGSAGASATAPAGQTTQPGPNQNQPQDAASSQQQSPAAHPATTPQPGAPAAQGPNDGPKPKR